MKKLALLFSLLASPALGQSYPPSVFMFIGYGQSTMDALTEAVNNSTGNDFSTDGVFTASGFSAGQIVSGSPISCGSLPNTTPITITTIGGTCDGVACTGTGGSGTYQTNYSGTALSSLSCGVSPDPTIMTVTIPSNVTPNAFMITTSPVIGPRGFWETIDVTNVNGGKPVLISRWSGFTPIYELFYTNNYGIGSFHLETPMSSFCAQANVVFASPTALVCEVMSHYGEDWTITCGSCLQPGGENDWANFISAQQYVKNNVQCSGCGSALTTAGYPVSGPWNYRTGGVALRLGESAAGGYYTTATSGWSSGSGGTIAVGNNGQYFTASNWCVYDKTSSTWLGYAASWIGTTLTFTSSGPISGGSSSDTIWLSPCYAGYLAELKSMVAMVSASDISDAPDPRGVPIFAHVPSSTSFGSGNPEKIFGFQTFYANVTEGLADRRFVVTGPSFMGPYQLDDSLHNGPVGNALIGSYMGKWAGWYYLGRRTAPFAMISASMPNGHSSPYVVRVTFQMPPSATSAEQTLQFYCSGCAGSGSADSNIPAIANKGFCYLDGTYEAGGTNFLNFTLQTGACASSASGISISSVALTAGSKNQVDITMSGDPSLQTNPTITLGAFSLPNGVSVWGINETHIFIHNVADSDCTPVANTALIGKAYFNSACGQSDARYLVDFADPSWIGVGQTLSVAW